MLVGFYGFLTTPLVGGSGASSTGGNLRVVGYVGAFITVLIAGFLFGVAMFLFEEGVAARGTPIDGPPSLSSKHARLAACAFLCFGAVASIALYGAVFVFLSGVSEPHLAIFYASWAVSAVVLVLAAIANSRFLSSLGRPPVAAKARPGLVLIIYSILNMTGVLLFTVPYLLREFVGASLPGQIGALGGMMTLIAIPVFGVAAFAAIALHGLRMRKALRFASSDST